MITATLHQEYNVLLTAASQGLNAIWDNPKQTAKQKLIDVLLDINVGKLAIRYFGKSPSWLYHKFDGVDGNKKPTDFTPEELQTLYGALNDLADRIRRSADSLIAPTTDNNTIRKTI